jgi:hypothetical protein
MSFSNKQHTPAVRERIRLTQLTRWSPARREMARVAAVTVAAAVIPALPRNEIAGVTLESRRVAVKMACGILGARELPKYVSESMGKLASLLKGGVTIEEALAVVRYTRRLYDSGDRFLKLLNLIYVWSTRHFAELECAMKTTPTYKREYHIGGMEDQSDPMMIAWNADYDRKVKAAGHDKESNTRAFLEAVNRTPEELAALLVEQRAWLAEQRRQGNL